MELEEIIKAKASHEEHDAWKAWCNEFENVTGESINNKENFHLVALIEKWGYALIALRKINAEYGHPEYQEYEIGSLFNSRLPKGK